MSNPAFSQFLSRWARGGRRPAAAGRAARPAKLRVEEFEARLVPAGDLPTPQVVGNSVVAPGFSDPVAAADPADPNNVVMVANNGEFLVAYSSTNGGVNWTPFFDTNLVSPPPPGVPPPPGPVGQSARAFRFQDPSLDRAPPVIRQLFRYTNTSGTSIAFARDGGVYITTIESNLARTSGAVILYAFDFNPEQGQNLPVIRDLDPDNRYDINFQSPATGYNNAGNLLYRWLGQDPVYNTTVAVNNNLPTFTDPQTGRTAVDTLAGKAVYVAYNTNATTTPGFPSVNLRPTSANGARVDVINPASVLVQASSDGGFNFSTPVVANDFAYFADSIFVNPGTNQPVSAVLPQIGFTPATLNPDSTVNSGGLVIGWQTLDGRLQTDVSRPDNGVAARPAVTAVTSSRVDLQNALIRDPSVANTILSTTFPFPVDLVGSGNMSPDDPITDIDFTFALFHPNPDQLTITLTNPFGQTATLLNNRLNPAGQVIPGPVRGVPATPATTLPLGTAGLGILNTNPAPNRRDNIVGITFDDEAARAINDPANVGPYAYRVRPDYSAFDDDLRRLYQGRTAGQLSSGDWAITVTDNVSNGGTPPDNLPLPEVIFVDVKASAYISNTGFGRDQFVDGAATLPVDATGTTVAKPAVIGPTGTLGAGVSYAFDNSLGSFSRFGGRLYAAYVAPSAGGDADIILRFSDNAGGSWSGPVQVSDDHPLDHRTEGRRIQFAPAVTVDQATGTVVVTWYDARNDAAGARVATYIATSNDGGRTFSPRLQNYNVATDTGYNNQVPSNQTYLNTTKTAIDAVTGRVVDLEPIPSNFTANNPAAAFGPGTRQSVFAFGGRVTAVWTGNENAAGVNTYATLVNIAAGPRILGGDQGPVVAPAGGPAGGYNNTFAADGTRRLDGFTVSFDRPVDTSTFTPADVEVRYRGAGTQLTDANGTIAGTRIPVASVTPLDPTAIAGFPNLLNATRYFVRFVDPQSAIGTYSYAVGPDIRDRSRNVLGDTATLGGNPMDQNADGVPGTAADRFSVPLPQTPGAAPFALPYLRDSLPLIVPGPHVVGTAAPGQPATSDNLVLNSNASALDITFDRDIVPSTFTRGNVLRITGPTGEIVGTAQFPITVAPVAVNPLTGGARTFRITFPPQVLSGGYAIEVGTDPANPDVLTNTIRAVDQPRLVTNLAAGATTVTVTFDRDVTRAVTPADVVRVTGPNGAVAGPFAVTPVAGNPRRFNVVVPAVPAAGQYVFEFADDLRVPAAAGSPTDANLNPLPLIDTNLNAGVDVLRGGSSVNGVLQNRVYRTGAGLGVPITAGTAAAPSVATLQVNVPDAFLVQQRLPSNPTAAANRRTIQLALNVQFPNVPDLRGVLVAPDGTEVVLFDSPGTQGDPNQNDFDGTVFDDASTTPISTAEPPFNPAAGTFNPQEPFARLAEPNRQTNAQGRWTVRIENRGAQTGVLEDFTLTLPYAVAGTGLGEPVADRFSAGFRVFTQDPSDPLTRQQWTPLGPAAQNDGYNSGRVTGLAVDPSDPSGNTVYAGGASGGVWKTTNFLTTDRDGPHWQPLTDFGPTHSLNIGSIAVFGRNGDTTQSVIIAATGEGDTLGVVTPSGPTNTGGVRTPGVGFIISADGGRTWRLLDSTVNVDPSGNYLAIESTDRDHRFVGAVAFKVLVDPTPTPSGDLIFYAALSDGAATPANNTTALRPSQPTGGVWRSNDTGRTWQLVQPGQATDIALAAGSAQSLRDPSDPNLSQNLQELYASFADPGTPTNRPGPATPGGVYFTSQAPSATVMGRVNGGLENPLFRDFDVFGFPQVAIETFPDTRPVEANNQQLDPPIQPDRTPSSTRPSPQGVLKGRISLATPAVTNDPARNLAYRGWVYALVSGRGGEYDGLYSSKDFGRNWTRVVIAEYRTAQFTGFGTNNTGQRLGGRPIPTPGPFPYPYFLNVPEHDLFQQEEGNFAQSIAVDPTNPAVVYIGGSNDLGSRQPLGGFLRVDTTRLEDAQNATAYSNSNPDYDPDPAVGEVPGTLQYTPLRGSVIVKQPGQEYGVAGVAGRPNAPDLRQVNTGYLNLFRSPADPLVDASLLLSNIGITYLENGVPHRAGFQNRGFNSVVTPMNAQIETNVHRILTLVDPLTGKTRLIVGDDQGVATVVDQGDGSVDPDGIGFAAAPSKGRTGNLQIGQFYYGAVQPSQLAADIARALVYGNSNDNGYPKSENSLLQDGGTRDWRYARPNQTNPADQRGPVGFTGNGVATDQVGTGVSYEFRHPERGGDLTNFFRVIRPTDGQEGVGRTNGLLQDRRLIRDLAGNLTGVADSPVINFDPYVRRGQWPGNLGANFAVNPVNRNAVVMAAPGNNQGVGRLFRTTDQGLNWFVIGDTPQMVGPNLTPGEFGPGLDGTYSQAVAFGAPNPAQPTQLDNFIYAGTQGGRVYVTRTGTGPWLNITAGQGNVSPLDGSAVQAIVTNPRRGSTDVFVVTLRGVYYKQDAFNQSAGWTNITGNLFQLQKAGAGFPGNADPENPGGTVDDPTLTLKYLSSIAADWRFQIPVDPTNPLSPTFPVLYVGGEGGVFRSADFGANWDYFPAATQYTDLDTGVVYDIPAGGYLPNVHVSDLDLSLGNIDPANGLPDQSQTGGLNMLVATTYGRGSFAIRLDNVLPPNTFVSGPRVNRLINPNPVSGPSNRLRVEFNTAVNPTSFTTNDVSLTDAAGNRIAVTRIVPVPNPKPTEPNRGSDLLNLYDIEFTPVTTSTAVSVVIGFNPPSPNNPTPNTPLISDFGGNLMNQDGDLVNGEPLVDQYRTTIVLSSGATNNRLVVSTSPATAVAGVPQNVVIEVRDADDRIITGATGLVSLNPAGGGTFSPAQADLVNGRATFPITFQTAGSNTVLVSLSGPLEANPTAFTTQVTAAAPTLFEITPAATAVTITPATPAVPVTFTVRARDPFGNPAAYTWPVTVTTSEDSPAVLLPEEPVQMVDGVATFTATFSAQGTAVLTVSGPDLVTPANPDLAGTATVTVAAGTATRLEVSVPAGPYVIGDVVTVTARALDAAGNPAVLNAGFVPTIGDPAATFTPARPSFVNGLATFTVTVQTPGTYAVTVTAGGLTGTSGPLTVLAAPPRPSPTDLLPGVTAVGSGPGGSPVVRVYNPDGTVATELLPFPPGFNNEVDPLGPGFTGGLRTAVADVTGDGVPDYVVGTGPGITAFVQVVDGKSNEAVLNFQPFADFKGGVFVAVGDITGDGTAEIVITPDEGGGPRVTVLRGGDFARVANFFGIADSNFRGGARAGVGDINGDGFADLVVSAGFGGGPRVSIFDGASLAQGRFVRPVGDFFVFEEALRNGAYVSVGDVNGDGFGDLIAGAGPGGGPRVLVLDGRQLLTEGSDTALAAPVANFFAGDTENRGGVRLAVKNLDGDRFTDVVTGAGESGGSGVTAYSGKSLAQGGADPLYAFDALADFPGGVFVG